MTDKEKEDNKSSLDAKSISALIKEVFSLLIKLLIVSFKHLMKFILKSIVWCLEKCGEGFDALKEFWFSSDTQEKKKKIIASCKQGAITFGEWCVIAWNWVKKYTVIGAKASWKFLCKASKLFVKYLLITLVGIWHGILWLIKTIKDLIIHSKPTFIRLGKDIKHGSIAFWHWLKRVGRGIKLGHIRRRRAWKEFRRTTTFKGMLIAMVKSISNGISSFMEEDQEESDPEAITEDDIIAEELEERQSTADKLGKKFFKGVKDIVEEK